MKDQTLANNKNIFANISDVAFEGSKFVKGPVRAVVVDFHGLGYTAIKTIPGTTELEYAAHGALPVSPAFGPWSWMNRQARRLVDVIVDRVYAENNLDDTVPLILTGGSMGGHAALNYARYAKRRPVAVACNCPVCDPRFHATERPDLPRTFLLAYGGDELSPAVLDAAMTENSPLEQVAAMPRIPYLIVHGDADQSVNKAAHSDRFVAAMRASGHDIEYLEAPGMTHGQFNDFAIWRRSVDFIIDAIHPSLGPRP
jgi:alpha-beta hydrolase superfamily lysophospholipase